MLSERKSKKNYLNYKTREEQNRLINPVGADLFYSYIKTLTRCYISEHTSPMMTMMKTTISMELMIGKKQITKKLTFKNKI